MAKFIVQKLKMTQIWKNDKVIPVTVLRFGKDDAVAIVAEMKEGEKVKISGLSKGKGFQGVVKRHGFHGGPQTHGQKNRQRAPGSIGSTAPQRVLPGRRMAGHMGQDRITLRLPIVSLLEEERDILVKGAVPGMKKTKLEISKI
ncbi:MAG: 50S ribosomal protein L3 [Candidatus Jorgensenbacteria bacterium GW2011_GWA1_48_11]|uniref:Large ribosomal subunit protein uL3 n=1 Tax=Candidatus Jorgensenbacteria bacterium GW2011_GWA1_48_11 TaxID=1618660 RepID=A0A0G1U9W2_9BACT|nr:MAG: 50S ribosomal protein L3 [Candidatus Jorgensenbacteria bacterium GW2011_GWA1_48_11]KKW12356.1 MAG: 50S ribosomal protein L3 [Candidatus Jorgensenbacteria bacterium GW2011_GWB1_49_9]